MGQWAGLGANMKILQFSNTSGYARIFEKFKAAKIKMLPINFETHNPEVSALAPMNTLSSRYVHAFDTLIAVLLRPRSPFAVLRRVSFLVINALKTKFVCTFTHIFEKVFKLKPAIAYLNSTTAVVFILAMFFVQAPALHRRPCFVFNRCWGGLSMSFCYHNQQYTTGVTES